MTSSCEDVSEIPARRGPACHTDKGHSRSRMSPSASVIVPSTPLLDASELEATLCCALRCEGSALQSLTCSVEKTGGGADGFLSKCGSMTVDAVVRGRAHQLHLFVKRADAKDVVEGMDSFGRESLFYQTVLPHLEKAWRRRASPEEPRQPDLGPAAYLGNENVVVMEDLGQLGYRAGDDWATTGFHDFTSVQQVLRALARLHAATLLAERLDGVDLARAAPDLLKENFMTRRPGTVGRRLFDCGADIICDVLLPILQPRLKVPQTKQELQRLRDATRDIFVDLDIDKVRAADASCGTGLMVLSHGDTWPNNVLYKFDEQGNTEHAVLIDFQMARLAPPAFDVVMFLHTGTRRSFRDQHMDALLRGYHDDLTRFTGERGLDVSEFYGWAVFLASVQRLVPLGRAIAACYYPLNSGNADDMAAMFQDSEARTALLMDSEARGASVARWLEREDMGRYRQVMQECVEELLGLPVTKASS